MKVGVYVPQVGPAASPQQVARVARAAEGAGFDSLWAFDHVVLRPDQGSDYPYSEDGRFLVPADSAFLEPLTLLTYAAAVTERVELGTAVLVLPMRAPVLHAKLIATLDHLAGGRVILGAGVGWWKEEFEALSMPFDRRGARMGRVPPGAARSVGRGGGLARRASSTTPRAGTAVRSRRAACRSGWAATIRASWRGPGGWPTAIWPTRRCWTRWRRTGNRVRQAASDAGREAAALRLGINRIAVLEEGRLAEAAERLGEMRALGFDHAIANLHPATADPEALLGEFAAEHLGALQGK